MAEGEGFEPPEPFPVQWFSRPPPSTTRPSLRATGACRLEFIAFFRALSDGFLEHGTGTRNPRTH